MKQVLFNSLNMNIFYIIKFYIKRRNKLYFNIMEKINMNSSALKYKIYQISQKKNMTRYSFAQHIITIE